MMLSTITNSAIFHSEPEIRSAKSSFWALAPPTKTCAPAGGAVARMRLTSAVVCSLSGSVLGVTTIQGLGAVAWRSAGRTRTRRSGSALSVSPELPPGCPRRRPGPGRACRGRWPATRDRSPGGSRSPSGTGRSRRCRASATGRARRSAASARWRRSRRAAGASSAPPSSAPRSPGRCCGLGLRRSLPMILPGSETRRPSAPISAGSSVTAASTAIADDDDRADGHRAHDRGVDQEQAGRGRRSRSRRRR